MRTMSLPVLAGMAVEKCVCVFVCAPLINISVSVVKRLAHTSVFPLNGESVSTGE